MTKRRISDLELQPFSATDKNPLSQRNAIAMAVKHPEFANWPARRVKNVQRAP